MNPPQFNVMDVAGTPVSATTGAASAVLALPLASDGSRARWCFVSTVAGSCYVMPGLSGTTVVAGSAIPVTTAGFFLRTRGYTHIAHIQITGAQTLVVVPLET
jgi:hypothetical protein